MTKIEEEGTSHSKGYKHLRDRISVFSFEEKKGFIRWECNFVICLKDYW